LLGLTLRCAASAALELGQPRDALARLAEAVTVALEARRRASVLAHEHGLDGGSRETIEAELEQTVEELEILRSTEPACVKSGAEVEAALDAYRARPLDLARPATSFESMLSRVRAIESKAHLRDKP
jgi:hypothetical protein